MTQQTRTSAAVRAGVGTTPTSDARPTAARDAVRPPPPDVPQSASGREGDLGVPVVAEHEAWFASAPSTPSSFPATEPPPRASSMPPEYKAHVVQTRLKRRKVVLWAVCALGGVVFALAAVRGILRHESPVEHPQVAMAVATAAQRPASTPSASAAPSVEAPQQAPTAGTARRSPPMSAPTGVAASTPRAISTPKRARSKGAFDPAAL